MNASRLVDTVVPAYGMYRQPEPASEAVGLSGEIHAYLATLESDILSGKVRAPAAADPSDKRKNQPVSATSETDLDDHLKRLTAWANELGTTGMSVLPIEDTWAIDSAYTDLERAAKMLRLGLDDPTYLSLSNAHQAWLAQHQVELARKKLNKPVAKPAKEPSTAIPEGAAKPTKEVPAAKPAKEAPAPVAQPEKPVKPTKKPVEKPVAPAPVAQPAPKPVEPAPPAPAPEAPAPAPEQPAPAPEAPAPEQPAPIPPQPNRRRPRLRPRRSNRHPCPRNRNPRRRLKNRSRLRHLRLRPICPSCDGDVGGGGGGRPGGAERSRKEK